jgi:hypothetical protein
MKKFTILMSLILLTFITGSAFAGLLDSTITASADDTRTRPAGLKAQVGEMKIEAPEYFQCMLSEAKAKWDTDENMVLYEVKKQVSAYWDFREVDYPEQIIVDAFEKWNCNMNMVMYEIKKQVSASNELGDLLN